jgi:hypothetical protein
MKRAVPAAWLALAALAAPASAQSVQPPQNGIVYPVTATGPNGLTATCTIVADRWTADYGPTTVYAAATAPNAISARVRCWVTKNYTTYVDVDRTADGSSYVLVNEGAGTIPVAGIQVCVEAEAQLALDVHPVADPVCING